MDNDIFTKDTLQSQSLTVILQHVADKTMTISEAATLITTIFQPQNNTVIVRNPFDINQLDGGVIYKNNIDPNKYKNTVSNL